MLVFNKNHILRQPIPKTPKVLKTLTFVRVPYIYMCVYCNLLTAMNLVGSTWTIWSPLISTHGITMHHFTDRHPETLDMASASDSLRRRSWPPESGGKVATEVVFPRFHSWILVMHGNVYVRLFLFVSVYFICGFAKCLLCFQLRNNIWTFSVFFCIFVVSVASLNNCWKVICGSRLARHVIDDANNVDAGPR